MNFRFGLFFKSTTPSGVVVDGGLILTGGFDREGFHTNIRYDLQIVNVVFTWKSFFSELWLIPHICHGRHGRRPCKFFLAGINFFGCNAKNWRFFTDLTRKIGVFLQI